MLCWYIVILKTTASSMDFSKVYLGNTLYRFTTLQHNWSNSNAKFSGWTEYKLFLLPNGKKVIYTGPYPDRTLTSNFIWEPCNALNKYFIEAIILLKFEQFQFSPPWSESFICKRGRQYTRHVKTRTRCPVINHEDLSKTTKIAT